MEYAFSEVKQEISEESEEILGVFEAYSRLLKLSNQFCQYISVHGIKSCLFGVLMVVVSDSCKSPVDQRLNIIDELPYIELKSEVLSESSLDALRMWNDFIFYLPKALNRVQSIITKFESITILLKSYSSSERKRKKYHSNYEQVLKSLICVKATQERLKRFEEAIKEYSVSLKKADALNQLVQVSSIISSCGGFGIENLMNLFAITPINKYPLN